MNIRANLQRDSIIFKHVVTGGFSYDSSCNKFLYPHRADDYTFHKIEEECRMAGLPFDSSDFNTYISLLRGFSNDAYLDWDRWLPDSMVVPGEIIELNPGSDRFLRILKIGEAKYIILDSSNSSEIYSIAAASKDFEFEIGKSIFLHPIGKFDIKWISFIVPDRVARTVDYINSKIYNRHRVDSDISESVRVAITALHQDEFTSKYTDIVKQFAEQGVSSSAVMHIANAFLKKVAQ